MAKSPSILDGAKKGFKQLPNIVQLIIVVVALVIVFVLVRSFFKKAQLSLSNFETNAEINAFEASGETLSYPKTQYKSWADSLFYGMDSQWYNPFSWGTDETVIESVFKSLNNNVDFLELNKAFGTRDGDSMAQWIIGEGEQETVNTILRAKNIQYSI